MKEHKHAAFLRDLADGASLDEYEAKPTNCHYWDFGAIEWSWLGSIISFPIEWEVRKKEPKI